MRKNLFLYLVLACFVGLIAIFVVDGYLGTYDTVYITAGEREEKIEADYWRQQEKFGFAREVWVNRGEKAFFHYEVDNRQFSSYKADIEVSLWRSQEKVRDLISQPLSVAAFDKGELEWIVDTKELLPSDAPPEQSYQFTVIIKRGEIERKLIVSINPLPYSGKLEPRPPVVVPAPVPVR